MLCQAASGTVTRRLAVAIISLALAGRVAAAQEVRAPADAPQPEPAVAWGAELDTSSRYIWHGLPFSTGAVLWPSVWISSRGFTASLWTVIDPDYEHVKENHAGVPVALHGPAFNEYDITAAYERQLRKLTLTATFSRYTYREPPQIPEGSTSEVILRAGYEAGPGEVFTTHAFDVEAHRGAYYAEVGYALERELQPETTIKIDASVAFWPAFADAYGIASDGPLGPATVNIAVVRKLAPRLSIRPHVTFMRLLDGAARREQGTPGLSGGLALSFGS